MCTSISRRINYNAPNKNGVIDSQRILTRGFADGGHGGGCNDATQRWRTEKARECEGRKPSVKLVAAFPACGSQIVSGPGPGPTASSPLFFFVFFVLFSPHFFSSSVFLFVSRYSRFGRMPNLVDASSLVAQLAKTSISPHVLASLEFDTFAWQWSLVLLCGEPVLCSMMKLTLELRIFEVYLNVKVS